MGAGTAATKRAIRIKKRSDRSLSAAALNPTAGDGDYFLFPLARCLTLHTSAGVPGSQLALYLC